MSFALIIALSLSAIPHAGWIDSFSPSMRLGVLLLGAAFALLLVNHHIALRQERFELYYINSDWARQEEYDKAVADAESKAERQRHIR